MPKLVVVNRAGEESAIEVDDGLTVMEAIRDNGFDELLALCGGCCSCATCHVIVDADWLTATGEPSDMEDDMLDCTATERETVKQAIFEDLLPHLLRAYESPGRLQPKLAAQTGLRKEPPVLIGGNDAVLAAYSVEIDSPGQIFNINGTCEITMVCLDQCVPSRNYNIRTHVLPERWFSFYVMNAGGKAFEWFKDLFCREMDNHKFFNEFKWRRL